MNKGFFIKVLAFAAIAGSASAQGTRRAAIVGGGSQYEGKCTVEVVVDSAAEVQIRGDSATLRDLQGQPPQWRRFECTAPMPANPANFRFAGVDGRGRQTLVSDPRNGGPAVVRIEDPDGGAEAYTFDIFWGGGNRNYSNQPYYNQPYPNQPYQQPYPNQVGPVGDLRDRAYERGERRFGREEAIRVCQDNIRQIAEQRFGVNGVNLRNVRIDDNPGRNDWVIGSVDVRRRFGRIDSYRFSCSVNFDNGRVRNAQIDQFEDRYYPRGGGQ